MIRNHSSSYENKIKLSYFISFFFSITFIKDRGVPIGNIKFIVIPHCKFGHCYYV